MHESGLFWIEETAYYIVADYGNDCHTVRPAVMLLESVKKQLDELDIEASGLEKSRADLLARIRQIEAFLASGHAVTADA